MSARTLPTITEPTKPTWLALVKPAALAAPDTWVDAGVAEDGTKLELKIGPAGTFVRAKRFHGEHPTPAVDINTWRAWLTLATRREWRMLESQTASVYFTATYQLTKEVAHVPPIEHEKGDACED